MSDKHTYLKLPNGDLIRSDCIVAVRLEDESIPYSGAEPIKPRVIIDYSDKNTGHSRQINAIIIYTKSNERRDQIASEIANAIVGAGYHIEVINA